MIVLNTGAEGHPFSARLPFSWEIMHLVHEILHTHIDEDEGNTCILTTCSAVPDQISIGHQVFSVSWYSIFIPILLCF